MNTQVKSARLLTQLNARGRRHHFGPAEPAIPLPTATGPAVMLAFAILTGVNLIAQADSRTTAG